MDGAGAAGAAAASAASANGSSAPLTTAEDDPTMRPQVGVPIHKHKHPMVSKAQRRYGKTTPRGK